MSMDYEKMWNELKIDLIDLEESGKAEESREVYRKLYMRMGKLEQKYNSDGNGKSNVSGDVKEDIPQIVQEVLKESGLVDNLEELAEKIRESHADETENPGVIFVEGSLEIPGDLKREASRRGIRIISVSTEVHKILIPPFLFGDLPFQF